MRAAEVVGVVLAVYNGFHVFLSHLAVVPGLQRQGVARHLHDQLSEAARRVGAIGVITDSRLTTTGFFYQLGYRTPGVVFLLHTFTEESDAPIGLQRLTRRQPTSPCPTVRLAPFPGPSGRYLTPHAPAGENASVASGLMSTGVPVAARSTSCRAAIFLGQ